MLLNVCMAAVACGICQRHITCVVLCGVPYTYRLYVVESA